MVTKTKYQLEEAMHGKVIYHGYNDPIDLQNIRRSIHRFNKIHQGDLRCLKTMYDNIIMIKRREK